MKFNIAKKKNKINDERVNFFIMGRNDRFILGRLAANDHAQKMKFEEKLDNKALWTFGIKNAYSIW